MTFRFVVSYKKNGILTDVEVETDLPEEMNPEKFILGSLSKLDIPANTLRRVEVYKDNVFNGYIRGEA